MAKKITIGVVCVFLLVGIYIAYEISNAFNEISIDTDRAITEGENRKDGPSRDEIKRETNDFYALLIGLDSRGSSLTLNTDTIIAAHILEDGKGVKLISLPRDLRVTNNSQRAVKINAIFAEGYQYARNEGRKNPDLLSGRTVNVGGWKLAEEYISSGMVNLRNKVEEVLDIDKIDYTFIVNFDTVTTLVDLVGGVEIDVKRSMHWDDYADGTSIHFEPGLQTLNGEQALNYARFRMDNRGSRYDSSDFERGLRQQEIISAIADEIISWKSLTQVTKIIDAVTDNVKTDMQRSEMISFASKMYSNMSSSSIETIPLPSYWRSPFAYVNDEDLENVKRQFHHLELGSPEDDEEQSEEKELESPANTQTKPSTPSTPTVPPKQPSNVHDNVYGSTL